MSKKKGNSDGSLKMSSAYFNTLKLVTDENISIIYPDPLAMFFIIDVIKNKITVLNSFMIRPQYYVGLKFTYYYYWDDNILTKNIHIKNYDDRVIEDEEMYEWNVHDTKFIIREEIKSKRLYARKAI